MRQFINNIKLKQIVFFALAVLSLLLYFGLTFITNLQESSLLEQRIANEWSKEGDAAQISAFFTEKAGVTVDSLTGFERQLDSALLQDSIVATSESARLYASTYSGKGEVTITSQKGNVTADAIGVAGDFFLFHPLKLVSGSYFNSSEITGDYILIDEEAAWQLFGSNDIAGKQVMIGQTPHFIAGVIERDDSDLYLKAGLKKTTVYLSYHSLETYGTTKGIDSYEIVMPNPITGFALKTVKEKIGVAETEVYLVENSNRYSLLSLAKIYLESSYRSMGITGVVFSYWENIARYYEDKFVTMLVFRILLLIYPIIYTIVFLVKKWKNRKWKWRQIPGLLKNAVVWINRNKIKEDLDL